MSVRFLTGTFGSALDKAFQDYETMLAGPITVVTGSTHDGDVVLEDALATFGSV